jgi:hypothetical protein
MMKQQRVNIKGNLYGVGGVVSQSLKSLPGASFREAVLFNKFLCGSVYLAIYL